MRVAALPWAAVALAIRPVSFLVRQDSRKVARSIVRTRVRMPTAARLLVKASPMVVKGGSGVTSPASKPLG